MDVRGVPYLKEIDRPIERTAPSDPHFPRASEVLADKVSTVPVAVMAGVPFGRGSLSGARCDAAPAAIRGALSRFSSYSSDFGVALGLASVLDAGDVDVAPDVAETQSRIEACVKALTDRAGATIPVVLAGGDNSITVGGAAGSGADAILTFDAHHDLRDGISNGSPIRQLMERGIPGERIVQIGIHGFANSRVYAERASEAGIVWVSPASVRQAGMRSVVDQTMERMASMGATRVWVDFDIDCLDRAFAPGTAASMPGGLWPAELTEAAFLCGASPFVCGMDITEVDPHQDVGQITVRNACAVLLAFIAGVVAR